MAAALQNGSNVQGKEKQQYRRKNKENRSAKEEGKKNFQMPTVFLDTSRLRGFLLVSLLKPELESVLAPLT